MKKFLIVIIFLPLVIYFLFTIYSLFVPQYVDKSKIFTTYPNRRCRCYGFFLRGKTTFNPTSDPSSYTPELCLGLQKDCEVLTEKGWNKELYKEISK